MTKWTKGPWRVNVGERHSPEECHLTIAGDIFLLADVNGPNYPHCEPNARLIAAAPALYDALEALVGLAEMSRGQLHQYSAALEVARAALLSAKGEDHGG